MGCAVARAIEQQCLLGNVDGVAGADLVVLSRTGAAKGQALVAPARAGRFDPAQVWSTDTGCVDTATCGLVDVDHDGRADLAAKPGGADTMWVSLSTGSAFATRTSQAASIRATSSATPSASKPPSTEAERCAQAEGVVRAQAMAEAQIGYIDTLVQFFGPDLLGANSDGTFDAMRAWAVTVQTAAGAALGSYLEHGDRCEYDGPDWGSGYVVIYN